MNYTPTIWSNGMKITAVRLNKLENNIEDDSPTALVFTSHNTEIPGETEINYTFNDIENAYLNGRNLYLHSEETNYSYYSIVRGIYYMNDLEGYCMIDGMRYGALDKTTYLTAYAQK